MSNWIISNSGRNQILPLDIDTFVIICLFYGLIAAWTQTFFFLVRHYAKATIDNIEEILTLAIPSNETFAYDIL